MWSVNLPLDTRYNKLNQIRQPVESPQSNWTTIVPETFLSKWTDVHCSNQDKWQKWQANNQIALSN